MKGLGVVSLLCSACVSLAACGTLLDASDDPPTSPGPDGSAGTEGGPPSPDGGASDSSVDQVVTDAAADGDASSQANLSFSTTFEDAQAAPPHGWARIVTSGGSATVSSTQHNSGTKSLEVHAEGDAFLERTIDVSAKRITLTVPIYVTSYPAGNIGSSVNVIDAVCGTTTTPLVQVRLMQNGMGTFEAPNGSGVARVVATDSWQSIVLDITRGTTTTVSVTFQTGASGSVVPPSCVGPITLRVGASYRAGQTATGADTYVYFIDDIQGVVTR